MSTKEEILAALRANTRETYSLPDLSQLAPITFADPVAEFKKRTTTTAGARLVQVKATDDLNAVVRTIAAGAASSSPESGAASSSPESSMPTPCVGPPPLIVSNLPEVQARLNPNTATVEELQHVDVGVVRGAIGVAENACVWIPQTMKERAVCFASEHLVIVLSAGAIVNNMHEAYARIAASDEYFKSYPFGTFISGPSKTADIESALVYGAQAARAVTVVLQES